MAIAFIILTSRIDFNENNNVHAGEIDQLMFHRS